MRGKQQKQEIRIASSRRRRIVLMIAAGTVMTAIVLFFALSPRKVVREETLTRWSVNWPPMPVARNPVHAESILRDAYAFAANREDVVRYIPCYCGCERKEHHQSLRDCFIRGRAADGTPRWDPMGYT
jgi:hypothetical protein